MTSPHLDVGGWIFLVGAWSGIVGLTLWCVARLVRASPKG